MVTILWTQVRFPLGSPRNLGLEVRGAARPGDSRDRGVSVSFQEGSSGGALAPSSAVCAYPSGRTGGRYLTCSPCGMPGGGLS